MTKKEVFELLMKTDYQEINKTALDLKKIISYEVIKKPSESLVMFRMRESVENSAFNVGEVLVTVCEVKVESSIGYSMIMGMDQASSENRAFLMGIFESDCNEKKEVLKLAENIKKIEIERIKKERSIINSTVVKFDLMGGQDPNVSHNKQKTKKE